MDNYYVCIHYINNEKKRICGVFGDSNASKLHAYNNHQDQIFNIVKSVIIWPIEFPEKYIYLAYHKNNPDEHIIYSSGLNYSLQNYVNIKEYVIRKFLFNKFYFSCVYLCLYPEIKMNNLIAYISENNAINAAKKKSSKYICLPVKIIDSNENIKLISENIFTGNEVLLHVGINLDDQSKKIYASSNFETLLKKCKKILQNFQIYILTIKK